MARVSRHPWTAEEIDLLYLLIKRGASPARASVVLKRPMLAVRSKARALGRPFPNSRQVRATRLGRAQQDLFPPERVLKAMPPAKLFRRQMQAERRQMSAGLWKFKKGIELLLGHPGGPFWRNKDLACGRSQKV
jgi:hypothetical protein